jgi:hypothetical protein
MEADASRLRRVGGRTGLAEFAALCACGGVIRLSQNRFRAPSLRLFSDAKMGSSEPLKLNPLHRLVILFRASRQRQPRLFDAGRIQ